MSPMSDLLDSSQFRAWPPRGGQASELSIGPGPTQSPEVSVPALVGSIVGTIEEDAKTASTTDAAGIPTRQNIWRHPDAHPLALGLLLLDRYGPEYLEWHPDVLKLTLGRDKTEVSNGSWSKILAGRVVLTSPSPWRQWSVFHWVCRALGGASPNFVYFEKPEIGHLVSGYEIMKSCDPKRPTGLDVDKFIAAVFADDGLAFIPPPLAFCTRELESRRLKCSKCQAIHRNDNDTRCITCGSKDLNLLSYDFEGLRSECADLWARESKKPLGQALESLPDTAAGNAVYRLLVEWDYARDVKSQLTQQLRMIGER